MSSNANEKFNAAGDRPLGAAKPVDPATRLSELLAQSLEELTRPFDPPRVDPLTRAPSPPPQAVAPPRPVALAPAPVHDEADIPVPTESRLDDKALAELEAELFAAASKPAVSAARTPAAEPLDLSAEAAVEPERRRRAVVDLDRVPPLDPDAAPAVDAPEPVKDTPVRDAPVLIAPEPEPAPPPPAPTSDADTARLVAKVRRLMFVSMGVTIIAVGSVFAFIGYRFFKVEGRVVTKTEDKVKPATAVPNEMTLALPSGARVVQSAVAENRLIITIDVGGRTEVRTYDLKTLQPAGRLTFSTTP